MNTVQLHTYLTQQLPAPAADVWPIGMVALTIAWLVFCVLLLLHALLRRRYPAPPQQGTPERLYLYPLHLRLWHGLNALLFLFLLISGLLTHFTLLPLAAMCWLVHAHPYAGYLLVVLWCGFLAVNLFGPNGRHYRIIWPGLAARCWRQARFYLIGIFHAESHPFITTSAQKFNPLQQLSYGVVMFGLLPLLFLSGFVLTIPQWLPHGTAYWALQGHLLLSLFGLMFISAHIYLCTLGETWKETFMTMLDGYHRHRVHIVENK
ncbi:thiosulfate reductase cytochrome B subunit [Edwardsiella hoshinae]|uniref:Thiosulfate reductase cytochrome B subunit n=1 Tax=Edwardsiella hoshinae TaxID=93378 RepID=A0ABN4SSD1_9GAMM|nr:thiosulfate reductase cytochrome B subunit [Edwardsiella hoshinae]AOV95668.1 thiosulfate reductase cytochrome B subunit [Edwardsiella hoshinae]